MALYQPEEVFQAQARLTDVFLRAPYDPSQQLDFVASMRKDLGLESDSRDPLVIGTAVSRLDDTLQLQLLLSRESDADPAFVKTHFGLVDFELALIVTGPIVPSGRPARGGESISANAPSLTGTLGCVVENAAGDRFALGCNHVIAGENSRVPGTDEVFQPGVGEGGRQKDRLGLLHQFWPIQFGGFLSNHIDAALARPDRPDDLHADLVQIGAITGVDDSPRYFDRVQKFGWETNYTQGTYTSSATFQIQYSSGFALFENQLGIVGLNGNFAEAGDSGAAVLNEANEVVGIQFAIASGINTSYVNRIPRVRQLLDVEVITT